MQVWLCQREMHLADDSLNGFVVAMMAAYLLKTKRLHPK
jgi:hypothetical protein